MVLKFNISNGSNEDTLLRLHLRLRTEGEGLCSTIQKGGGSRNRKRYREDEQESFRCRVSLVLRLLGERNLQRQRFGGNKAVNTVKLVMCYTPTPIECTLNQDGNTVTPTN